MYDDGGYGVVCGAGELPKCITNGLVNILLLGSRGVGQCICLRMRRMNLEIGTKTRTKHYINLYMPFPKYP